MENKFGLLGRKLGHSWSPQIHTLLCGYPYGLYEVEPEGLGEFLRTTDLQGMNVTIPYKKDVIPYCTSLSPAAQAIGSVNTLVKTPQGWYGDNTDYAGFVTMTESSGVPVKGKKALVFGTGGASLAVKAALRDMGADPIVSISRTGEDNYGNLSRHADAAVLVNTTPLGMYPDTGRAAVSLADFPACELVLDVVYNPSRTALLLDAEARNIPNAGGLTMLVAQARRSAEQFAGHPIDDSAVFNIVKALRSQMDNIILIGMPGCGKSAVGRRLAELTGRELIDADAYLIEQAGISIPEIFEKEGEAGFRVRETQVLSELGKRSGIILATGGGCVTRPENYPLLHQNGTIFWIQRALENLAKKGRPISLSTPTEQIYAARRDLYAAYSDHIVVSDEVIEHTAQKILAAAGLAPEGDTL